MGPLDIDLAILDLRSQLVKEGPGDSQRLDVVIEEMRAVVPGTRMHLARERVALVTGAGGERAAQAAKAPVRDREHLMFDRRNDQRVGIEVVKPADRSSAATVRAGQGRPISAQCDPVVLALG